MTSLSPDVLLATENLTKKFGRRTAVNGLSLDVHRGDVFGFLGPNGAGKSTTMRMILGLVHPTAGSVRVGSSEDAQRGRPALTRVGAVVEAPCFYRHLSGWENLRIFSALGGGASDARIKEAFEVVGLRGREHDPVGTYSHGMRQRLGIAQALLPESELVLLDEPGEGLDPRSSLDIRRLIRRLADERRLTIFLSSHFLHEVEQLCNRVAILNQGRLLYQGSVAGLLTQESHLRVGVDPVREAREFLRGIEGVRILLEEPRALTLRLQGVDPAWLNARLVEQGLRVYELRTVKESLESVFLRLTGEEAAA
jgi:ABC-2 type transport system ATP-binding protein